MIRHCDYPQDAHRPLFNTFMCLPDMMTTEIELRKKSNNKHIFFHYLILMVNSHIVRNEEGFIRGARYCRGGRVGIADCAYGKSEAGADGRDPVQPAQHDRELS